MCLNLSSLNGQFVFFYSSLEELAWTALYVHVVWWVCHRSHKTKTRKHEKILIPILFRIRGMQQKYRTYETNKSRGERVASILIYYHRFKCLYLSSCRLSHQSNSVDRLQNFSQNELIVANLFSKRNLFCCSTRLHTFDWMTHVTLVRILIYSYSFESNNIVIVKIYLQHCHLNCHYKSVLLYPLHQEFWLFTYCPDMAATHSGCNS